MLVPQFIDFIGLDRTLDRHGKCKQVGDKILILAVGLYFCVNAYRTGIKVVYGLIIVSTKNKWVMWKRFIVGGKHFYS